MGSFRDRLKRLFGRRRGKGVVGFDGGSRRLKVIRLRTTKKGSLIVEDLFQEVRTPEAMGAMRKTLAERGYSQRPVAFSLADENVEIHNFKLPLLEKTERETAIEWELKKTVASPEFVVHDVLTYERKDGFEVECVVAARDVVQDLHKRGIGFGLVPKFLETESSALAACLRGVFPGRDLDRVAVVDLGHHCFRLVFIHQNRVSFTRSLYFGIGSLCAQVSAQTGEKSSEVIRILESLGIGLGSGPVATGLQRGLQETLYNLCEEFRRSEFYVKDKKGFEEIQEVHVCGGGAMLRPSLPYLAEHLPEKKVALLDPLAVARLPEKREAADGPLWAVAVGLALREAV